MMDKKKSIIISFVSYVIGLLTGGALGINEKQNAAMEVYRGNTTLQYTVVNSVIVDSCVVFKNNRNEFKWNKKSL